MRIINNEYISNIYAPKENVALLRCSSPSSGCVNNDNQRLLKG